jgi:hypothetical protein
MVEMNSLQPLVGRWATTITLLSPPEAAGQVHQAVDTYRWLTGGQTLVHEVEARMGDQTVHSVEVYSLKDGQIVSRNFDGGGVVSDYAARMQDGVWRVEGETERFTSTAIDDAAIEGLWELKGDDGWGEWMRVRLARVG